MKKLQFILFIILLLTGCQKKSYSNNVVTIIEHDQNTLIGINYPITNQKKLDKIIKKDIEKQHRSFKKNNQSNYSSHQKSELNIDYSFQKIANYYNISTNTYLSNSKQALTKNYIKTYVYDLKKKKLLTLKDILPEGDLYYLTKYTKNFLIKNSTLPKNIIYTKIKQNYNTYQNFTFDQDYLYLYFDSHTFTYNNFQIKIPLENLNPIIDIDQKAINTINTKIKVPTKILDPSKKFIALTFDDGPSIYTKDILKILKKYHSNATFFVLGNKVEIYQDTIRQSIQDGNEIGNHSYSHKWLIKLNEEELNEQISKTQNIIKNTTGYTPKLLRPTYGSVNQKIKELKNFQIVLWNVDTLDWKYKNIDRIVSRATQHAKDGNIILMHDIHQRTVKALEKIIPILQKQGFELITVSEMEEIKFLRSKRKTE